jgi:hypothetical protein
MLVTFGILLSKRFLLHQIFLKYLGTLQKTIVKLLMHILVLGKMLLP